MFRSLRGCWLVGILFSVALVLPGWQASAQEKKGPAAKEPAEKPADPYALPESGKPADLAEFIKNVLKSPPESMDERAKAMKAMLEAADKILDGKPNDDQLQRAVRIKMMFSRETKQLEALAGRLKKAQKPKLVRMVRGAILERRLGESMRGPAENIKKVVGEVQKFVGEKPLDIQGASLAMSAAQASERAGDDKFSVKTYTSFAKAFNASKNPQIAGMGKAMEAVVRRLTLVGNTMKIDGKLVDGKPFDWAKYRGKIVLVDFWATWCGPCVREVPNMLKTYERYHDLGFDIVGISLDRERTQLEQFIKQRKIPWTILFDDSGRNATARYYAIRGIPTMILVGADGKVISTRARGHTLSEELKKLLGPGKEPEKKPDAKEKPGT